MHRDSHAPLKPIFGNHFLALACHDMSLEDLEVCKLRRRFTALPDVFQSAQRGLLLYFSYNLCMPTPQVFLDELPLALPTLRHALESEHEWEDVLSETWKQLFAAARCTCYPAWHLLIVPFRFSRAEYAAFSCVTAHGHGPYRGHQASDPSPIVSYEVERPS